MKWLQVSLWVRSFNHSWPHAAVISRCCKVCYHISGFNKTNTGLLKLEGVYYWILIDTTLQAEFGITPEVLASEKRVGEDDDIKHTAPAAMMRYSLTWARESSTKIWTQNLELDNDATKEFQRKCEERLVQQDGQKKTVRQDGKTTAALGGEETRRDERRDGRTDGRTCNSLSGLEFRVSFSHKI